jgi:hypothetical protein
MPTSTALTTHYADRGDTTPNCCSKLYITLPLLLPLLNALGHPVILLPCSKLVHIVPLLEYVHFRLLLLWLLT